LRVRHLVLPDPYLGGLLDRPHHGAEALHIGGADMSADIVLQRLQQAVEPPAQVSAILGDVDQD
jgi:hypothetical protein